MRLLFLGGTGLISSACSELAIARGHELLLLTRGTSSRHRAPAAAKLLKGDVRADAASTSSLLGTKHFDAVVDFLAFTREDIERDLALFRDRTDQFVFISSASGYQKPPRSYLVDETTALENPYWDYARGKIACEDRLRAAHRQHGFPATIVRPSLTYGPSQIPLCVGSWAHPWTVIDRMKRGQEIIVPGDGTSLWVLTWNADFAVGLVGLLGKAAAIGETFHITSDEVLTWDRIYLETFKALGLSPTIVHVPSEVVAAYWPHALGSLLGDKMNSVVFDNSKIKALVPEFVAQVRWAEGLRRALEWHESHPEFQTVDGEFDMLMDEIVRGYRRAFPSS
jgi:nucleoside-diphosphate-sugar epimerase